MSSVAIEKPAPAYRVGLFAALGSVGLIAVIGLLLTVQAFVNLPGVQGTPAALGSNVPTSFGFVSVTSARALDDQHVMPGKFTGPGAIPANQRAIQIAVTISNQTDHQVQYSSDAFALRLGADKSVVKASEATFYSGALLPKGEMNGQLTFLVPLVSSTPLLQYSDPDRTEPILIDLGDYLSGADGSGHDHSNP